MTDIKTGFSGNPQLDHLYFRCKPYHETIPDRFFNGKYAYLLEELTFTDKQGMVHHAKKGLIIDGGSLPHVGFILRWIGTPYELYLPAYVIHDQECKNARDIARSAKKHNSKDELDLAHRARKEADATFEEMLEWINDNLPLIKCPKAKRGAMWLGVRLGAIGSIILGRETMGREALFKEKKDATKEDDTQ